jgi:hypothetical protein
MRGILTFGTGLGVGYVLGTRAGRERYAEISEKAKHVWESKTVQDAAGAVHEGAGRLYEGSKQMMSGPPHDMHKSHKAGPQQQLAEHHAAQASRM